MSLKLFIAGIILFWLTFYCAHRRLPSHESRFLPTVADEEEPEITMCSLCNKRFPYVLIAQLHCGHVCCFECHAEARNLFQRCRICKKLSYESKLNQD